MKNIGQKLRECRKEQELTIDQLSELSGIDRTTIWGYEVGRHTPRIQAIEILLYAMGYELNITRTRDEEN